VQLLLSEQELETIANQALNGIFIQKISAHTTPMTGEWPSPRTGPGLDFEEARAYQPGDDLRQMDWRTTARLGQPHVRVHRDEQQPVWHLVLDRRTGMRFGTRRRLKVAQAARVAVWLAHRAQAQDVALGATLWDRHDETLPARHGAGALEALVAAFIAPCPPDTPSPEEPDTPHRLQALRASVAPGTHLWLLTDGEGLTHPDTPAPLAALAATTQLALVRITDPAEHTPPVLGTFWGLDTLSGERRWLGSGWPDLQGLRTRQDAVLRRCGVPVTDLTTPEDAPWQRLST
jgi:uncharacterized protein (DUF58 family)